MSRPLPVARADSTPDTSAKAALSPVIRSTMERPMREGGPSGSPVTDR